MNLDRKTIIAFAFLAGAGALVVRNILAAMQPAPIAQAADEQPLGDSGDLEADFAAEADTGAGHAGNAGAAGRLPLDLLARHGSFDDRRPMGSAFATLAEVLADLAASGAAAAPAPTTPSGGAATSAPPEMRVALILRAAAGDKAVVDGQRVVVGSDVAAGRIVQILDRFIVVQGPRGLTQHALQQALPPGGSGQEAPDPTAEADGQAAPTPPAGTTDATDILRAAAAAAGVGHTPEGGEGGDDGQP